MEARRAALICLLLGHILLVWGGIGLLGEIWIRAAFCVGSHFAGVTWVLLALWLVSTLSPVVGIVAVWRDRLWTVYLYLVALSLFVLWLTQFLVEIRVTYCDSL